MSERTYGGRTWEELESIAGRLFEPERVNIGADRGAPVGTPGTEAVLHLVGWSEEDEGWLVADAVDGPARVVPLVYCPYDMRKLAYVAAGAGLPVRDGEDPREQAVRIAEALS